MFSCSQSWLWQKNFFTCYHVPVTKNNDNFCLGSCPFCHLPGPRSRWKNLANQHDYFLWFLASGGGLPVFPKIYSIAQWSCSTSLSLWKIPDSNPGPLQSGALPTNKPPHLRRTKMMHVFGSPESNIWLQETSWRPPWRYPWNGQTPNPQYSSTNLPGKETHGSLFELLNM